jgi:tetratricopeptide (TPR) repeat protein
MGLVFLEQGNLKRALESFEKAVKANPKLANSHNNYGMVLELVTRLSKAETEYVSAVGKKGHFIASFNLANIRTARQSFPDAITRYNEVIEFHHETLDSVRDERRRLQVRS